MIRTIGKYRIDGILGRGAMGIVYKAFDRHAMRTVALKTIRKERAGNAPHANAVERLKTEARTGGRLQHPNIVPILDYGEYRDMAYIAMELVEGTSLATLLGHNKPIEAASAFTWMVDLLHALDFAHTHGVVHRDIKPANLLITKSNHLKVSDFGIAFINATAGNQFGSMAGTPNYMSPEQFRGEALDGRSDLFSAGIVLYQLLTGTRPFSGTTREVMHQILTVSPMPPSKLLPLLGRSFDAIVAKALAKSADDRYGSAKEFLDALVTTDCFWARGVSPAPKNVVTTSVAAEAYPRLSRESNGEDNLGSDTVPDKGLLIPWKQAALPELEALLCHQIGPAGKLLAQKAAATASGVDALAATLLELIPSPRGRVQFQKSLAKLMHSLDQIGAVAQTTPTAAHGGSSTEVESCPSRTDIHQVHH